MDTNLKEEILSRPIVTCKEVMLFTGWRKSRVYEFMKACKENYEGTVPFRRDAITTRSMCLALGTTLEEQIRQIGIAKGYIK